MSDESHEQRHARFARIRRAKWLLRFTPRRASLHRYPFIGRFADFARRRSYLWSFRTEHVRPAIYAGSIVALLPIMGVQIPVAFVLALLLRSNVMLLVGLQFITNPFTAWFMYPATYQVGRTVIEATGFGGSIEVEDGAAMADSATRSDDHASAVPDAPPEDALHADTAGRNNLRWTQRFGTAVNALVLGGVITGAVLGLILDVIWRLGVMRNKRHRGRGRPRRAASDSTGRRPPPM